METQQPFDGLLRLGGGPLEDGFLDTSIQDDGSLGIGLAGEPHGESGIGLCQGPDQMPQQLPLVLPRIGQGEDPGDQEFKVRDLESGDHFLERDPFQGGLLGFLVRAPQAVRYLTGFRRGTASTRSRGSARSRPRSTCATRQPSAPPRQLRNEAHEPGLSSDVFGDLRVTTPAFGGVLP